MDSVGRLSDGTQLFVVACAHHWYEAKTTCDAKNLKNCTGGMICTDGGCAEGVTIPVPASIINETPPDRFGLAYGALVVRFKFQLTGKREFKGSASLGPYAGYRFDRQGSLGFALTIAGFAGVGNVSDTDTTTTTDDMNMTHTDTDTKNLASFSYGVGLLGVIKGAFQLGAVVGFDHADKGYRYNDKPWIAMQIGYECAQ